MLLDCNNEGWMLHWCAGLDKNGDACFLFLSVDLKDFMKTVSDIFPVHCYDVSSPSFRNIMVDFWPYWPYFWPY